jgi:hypothetical protein
MNTMAASAGAIRAFAFVFGQRSAINLFGSLSPKMFEAPAAPKLTNAPYEVKTD